MFHSTVDEAAYLALRFTFFPLSLFPPAFSVRGDGGRLVIFDRHLAFLSPPFPFFSPLFFPILLVDGEEIQGYIGGCRASRFFPFPPFSFPRFRSGFAKDDRCRVRRVPRFDLLFFFFLFSGQASTLNVTRLHQV